MILFSYLFLFAPIGLPGLGTTKAISGISGVLQVLVHHLDYFLTFVSIIIIITAIHKIYKIWVKRYFKKIEILFYRLYSEILLLDSVKSSKIDFSEKESIDLILSKINRRFFVRRVGKINKERLEDGLKFIKSGKLDTKTSLLFVQNWIKMLNYLIVNL